MAAAPINCLLKKINWNLHFQSSGGRTLEKYDSNRRFILLGIFFLFLIDINLIEKSYDLA